MCVRAHKCILCVCVGVWYLWRERSRSLYFEKEWKANSCCEYWVTIIGSWTVYQKLALRCGVFVRFHVELTCYSLGSFHSDKRFAEILMEIFFFFFVFVVFGRQWLCLRTFIYIFVYYWIIDIIVAGACDYFKPEIYFWFPDIYKVYAVMMR